MFYFDFMAPARAGQRLWARWMWPSGRTLPRPAVVHVNIEYYVRAMGQKIRGAPITIFSKIIDPQSFRPANDKFYPSRFFFS